MKAAGDNMKFKFETEQPSPLAIHELLLRHANELWMPDHFNDGQAAAFVLDHFRRQVMADLAMVTVGIKRKNNSRTVLPAKCAADQTLKSKVVDLQQRLPSLRSRFAIAVAVINQPVHWRQRRPLMIRNHRLWPPRQVHKGQRPNHACPTAIEFDRPKKDP
jgi:hypothetical protein